MKIVNNTFAHACVEQNTLAELRTALQNPADKTDCTAWNLTAAEWREQIEQAISYLESGKYGRMTVTHNTAN